MPLTPAYNPTASFANDETNQVAGRSTVRTAALDTELANISSSINAGKANLEKLQRDDGKLQDFLVEPYALSEQARALITSNGTPRGLWAPGVVYAVGDVVQESSVAYICYTPHTSADPFTANGFWISISGDGSAAASAAAAAASQTAAATSATNAAASAETSTTKAGEASTSATAAANSATAAGNSATAAASSAGTAATSASNAAASFDAFDDRWMGDKAADPATDNDGNPLTEGVAYWNTVTKVIRVYNASGGVFQNAVISSSSYIATLLDDVDSAAARVTLGVGAATTAGAGLVELATDAEVQAGTSGTVAVTPQSLRNGAIVGIAPVALSGTAVDFTSIPSWAKRITVQYSGLSTNGTALPIVQLGDSGGPETSGYVGSVFSHSSGDFPDGFSSGFAISGVNAATSVYEGTVTLTLHNAATNTWTASIVNGNSTGVGASFGGGSKALTATLDRIRLTTVGGTNVFDGGTASLLIE